MEAVSMGRLTVVMSDELEMRLREHLVKAHGLKYFGKISEFVSNAVKKSLNELDGKEGA
jgi:predicted small metal-binding protein